MLAGGRPARQGPLLAKTATLLPVRGLRRGMITLHALGLLLSLAAPEASLTIDVERGGDVRWKDSPCTIAWRSGDSEGTGEPGTSFNAPVGKIDVILRCSAEEGVVAKSLRFDVRGDVKKVVTLTPGFITTQVMRDAKQVAAEVATGWCCRSSQVGCGWWASLTKRPQVCLGRPAARSQ
jgi:hypothetical protein